MRRLRQALAGACVVSVALLAPVAPAGAHAVLDSTSPAAGSVVDASPSEILLRFTEPIDLVEESLRLVSGSGADIDLARPNQDRGADTMAVELSTLDRGTYVVVWKAISSDSHPINGAFTFSVGEPSDTSEGLVDSLLRESQRSRVDDTTLAVGRAASFAGVVVLAGAVPVVALIAPARRRHRRVAILVGAASAAAVAGTLVMIAAQGVSAGGGYVDTGAWADVVRTRAGRWWAWRVPVVVVFVVAWLVARRRMSPSHTRSSGDDGSVEPSAAGVQVVLAGISAALLAVVAAGGHSVSGRWVQVGFAATWVHLAAAAIWLTGLTALVVVVPGPQRVAAARRFSPLGLGAVAALAVSGGLNAVRQTADLDGLMTSTYGHWLLVKLALVVGVVVVAAGSRWVVHQTDEPDRTPTATRRLLAVELVGIVAIVAATSGLVDSPPPRDLVAQPASVTAVQGNRIAQILLDPAARVADIHVTITGGGGALDAADEITLQATHAVGAVGPIDIAVESAGPNHVIARGVSLPLAGVWTFTVTARYGEFDEVVFVGDVAVR